MLQKTTDEALRAEDDLAEAIDLIWMLDAAVRGLDFDPDTPQSPSTGGEAANRVLPAARQALSDRSCGSRRMPESTGESAMIFCVVHSRRIGVAWRAGF
jgi:hypothetical protein